MRPLPSAAAAPTTIVCYAVRGREPYPIGLPRLSQSLRRVGPALSCLFLAPELGRRVDGRENLAFGGACADCPTHAAVPYGFKPYAIRAAAARGFRTVLWCDSAIVFQRDPAPLVAQARAQGVVVFDNPGCPQATWTSDDALLAMGCPLEEARAFNQVQAGAACFDFDHPVGARVFAEWEALAADGTTFAGRGGSDRPDFRDHRHDQSALSWLARKHGIVPEPQGVLCYHHDRSKFRDRVIMTVIHPGAERGLRARIRRHYWAIMSRRPRLRRA
jgi:hypothetical protein